MIMVLLVTAATAAADAAATGGSFLTEKDVIICVCLHGILRELHAPLRENILFPGFYVFLYENIPHGTATGKADE